MAEDENGQEKTEEPTSKRKQQAKDEGQVPRSRELSSAAVLIAGAAYLFFLGDQLVNALVRVFKFNFRFDRMAGFDHHLLINYFVGSILEVAFALAPLFLVLMLATVVPPFLMGSWNFSTKSFMPQFSRLNPLKGVKKMFSLNSLVELIKTLAKFIVVALVAIGVLYFQHERILALANLPFEESIYHGVEIVIFSALIIVCSLLIIVVVDVPYQLWNHNKNLRMTKQQIKDEYKDTEGKPEVKGRIRQLQREMAQRRMMSNVPQADVIITNPTHYSVALKYDAKSNRAPIVLAKGADHVALKIREIANHYEIVVLQAPPLARAIYHHAEVDGEIPEGLYLAVAQVLAYVYQIDQFKKGRTKHPGRQPNYPIPEDLKK